jgi:hypothetical protein
MNSLDSQMCCLLRITATLFMISDADQECRIATVASLQGVALSHRQRQRLAAAFHLPLVGLSCHAGEIYPACQRSLRSQRQRRPNMGISTLPRLVSLGELGWHSTVRNSALASCSNAKKPPGNRVAFSLGRIVPTEARPSELSWRHSMGGLLGCQGQIIFVISCRFYWCCCMSAIHALKPMHSPYVRHRQESITDKSSGLLVLLWRLHHPWFNCASGKT